MSTRPSGSGDRASDCSALGKGGWWGGTCKTDKKQHAVGIKGKRKKLLFAEFIKNPWVKRKNRPQGGGFVLVKFGFGVFGFGVFGFGFGVFGFHSIALIIHIFSYSMELCLAQGYKVIPACDAAYSSFVWRTNSRASCGGVESRTSRK